MTQHALLNNLDHRDVRVLTTRSARLGDDVMLALTFPTEFRSVQAHYPIVFRKSAQGQFQPVVLFGFQEKQNLFLTSQGWDATYVPLMIERQPFLIGAGADQLMMHIDLDHPRVRRGTNDAGAGEALFLEHGGTTEFLQRMNAILLTIHEGLQKTSAFVAAMLESDLLESFVLDIASKDGTQSRLAGFYTIHEERLAMLSGPTLEKLSRAGHLQAAYMVLASLSNFRELIERRNRLHALTASSHS